VGHFDRRNLVILNEAHNIKDKLMKMLKVTITNKSLSKDYQENNTPIDAAGG